MDRDKSILERERERQAHAGSSAAPAQTHSDTHPWKNDVMALRQNITVGFWKLPDELASASPIYPPRHKIETPHVLHSAIMEFVGYLAPMRDELDDLWNAVITTQEHPKDGAEIGGIRTDNWGDFDIDPLAEVQWDETEVTLSTLRPRWAGGWDVWLTLEYHDEGRWQTEERRVTAKLSPDALRAVVEQADMCARKLGWLPETSSADPTLDL